MERANAGRSGKIDREIVVVPAEEQGNDQLIVGLDQEDPNDPTMVDPPEVFEAETPIVGGKKKIRSSEEAGWTGGIPNRNFSGAKAGFTPTLHCPLQLRPH